MTTTLLTDEEMKETVAMFESGKNAHLVRLRETI